MDHITYIKVLTQRLEAAGMDNARRAAEELLSHVLGCKPLEIYLDDTALSPDRASMLEALASRAEKGEPLQYIIGHVDFMGLEIKCDPRALIPRPETELLVEEILNSAIWKAGPDGRPGGPSLPSPHIADVGTGTGCIVLALAMKHLGARFTAVDRSPAALELARENAAAHGLENRIHWKEGHLLDGFTTGSFDAVAANLPYIATEEWRGLSPGVRDHEPRSALDSGPSGMELIAELAEQARDVLVPGGMLFLEFGFDQGEAVQQCLMDAGYQDIRIKTDLAGHDRMAVAVKA